MEKIIEIVKSRHEIKDYKYHILPVVKNAMLLADKLKADREIVEMAAYLHDIGRAGKGRYDEDHEILGEAEARKILTSLKIDPEKIEKVCSCILTHRKNEGRNPESLAAEIIINADAMSHCDGFLWLWAIYYEQRGIDEARIELIKKMHKDWDNKLFLPEAKEIVKEKHESILALLKEMEYYAEK